MIVLARARAAVHQVGDTRTQDADEVDAAVFVEAVVLDREHRLLHHVRNVLEAHEAAALSPNSPISTWSAVNTRSGTFGW